MPALTRSTADRYALYQASVQEPDADLDFVDAVLRSTRGKGWRHEGLVLREDFCGTALTASRWVQRHGQGRAIGVDLDPVPLQWGREQIVPKLTDEERSRLTLIEGNVLHAEARGAGLADAIMGLNFSYWCFTTRAMLLEYFRAARAGLVRGGVLILDAMAGSDVLVEQVERSRKKLPDGRRFTYVWDQRSYDPISGAMRCTIGFEFDRGQAWRDAFTYSWRLWTLPEIRDVLLEAGFADVHAYVEGEGPDGEGTGRYVRRSSCAADRCILAYLVAHKG